ncbi:DUF4956 domain-containing protein [Ancylomarina sp. 16SWW S1-10-2]|uniref:DUF4956 domain-containing protein n=1 Tax=Ancylomarina sp. 16SWW S1-10-2 TaxID=2499681 RepID=UPI0012AE71CB|nr:DUF4956 domain-containing protein [Ancylomarina sp. 16SWW S1-10-2]MRT92372.1 DUF4956 domain-containing protein [Ancylomarina sp. 16SWW S1-10-2]
MNLFLNLPEISTGIQAGSFIDLLLRFGLNLLASIFIIIFVYFRATGKRSYVFTYVLISITIFFLCYLLGSIDLQLGFALGLFAIFGIIRYRTDTIPIREMTYLFLIITLSVVNALASREVSLSVILFTNCCLMATTWVMENVWMKRHLARRSLIFDRVDLIHPSKKNELIENVFDRTGVVVVKFKVGKIDLIKKSVSLTIFYKEDVSPYVLSDPEMSDKSFERE